MGGLGGDDVDRIQPFAGNHFLEIRVLTRHVVPLGHPSHGLWAWIANRRELHSLQPG